MESCCSVRLWEYQFPHVLPTGHQSLSILFYPARKTPHCGRTTPPSYAKWWFCIFQQRVWPLEIRWSTMVAFTLYTLKKLYSSVWKTEGRTTCSRRVGRSFIDFTLATKKSTSLYIKWHIYPRLQYRYAVSLRYYRARPGDATFRWIYRISFNDNCTLHRCIYKSPSLDTPRLTNL